MANEMALARTDRFPSITQATQRVTVSRSAAGWPWPLPPQSVVAVLDRDQALQPLRQALLATGIESGQLHTASGKSGAQCLRESAQQRGVWARLVGVLDDEDGLREQMEARASEGKPVILVQTCDGAMPAVLEALEDAGATVLRRTGRWTFTGDAA